MGGLVGRVSSPSDGQHHRADAGLRARTEREGRRAFPKVNEEEYVAN
jgi:hypothetical protein